MKNKRNKWSTALILLLTIISIFCTTQTVLSREADAAVMERERYFDTLEKDYVENVRTLLKEKGYSDSGVMMTAVISADSEAREYTISIHNKRFERLSEGRKEALLSELAQTSFPEAGCSFLYCFL